MPQAQRRTDLDDDDEDIDERGILRDGRSTRVAMVFADGTTVTRRQFLDAIRERDPLIGCRPSYCDTTNTLIDSGAQDAKIDAWEERGRINRDMWKTPAPNPYGSQRSSTARAADERNAPGGISGSGDLRRSPLAGLSVGLHQDEQGDSEAAWELRGAMMRDAWRS